MKNVANMKTYTIYEKSDLDKFEQQLFYFLQGDNGFYQRNNLKVGTYNHLLTGDKELFIVSKAIQEAHPAEVDRLSTHIDKRLEDANQRLIKAEKELEGARDDIHKYEQLKSMSSKWVSLRDAFEYLT